MFLGARRSSLCGTLRDGVTLAYDTDGDDPPPGARPGTYQGRVRKRARVPAELLREPFGLWVQTAPLEQLTPSERETRARYKAWTRENRTLARQLDRLVGQRVALLEARETVGSSAGVDADDRGLIPARYGAGRSFLVIGRVEGRLLGRTADGVVIELHVAWIRLVRTTD